MKLFATNRFYMNKLAQELILVSFRLLGKNEKKANNNGQVCWQTNKIILPQHTGDRLNNQNPLDLLEDFAQPLVASVHESVAERQ